MLLTSGGRPLCCCTVPNRRRRLPASVLTRGRDRSASCRVDRERREELTRRREERVSVSPVQRILCRRLREWSSYNWRAVGQPSSSRTSDMWSNFRRPETTRSAKFRIFWRRCMFLSEPFPKTARQYRTCERTRALTMVGRRSFNLEECRIPALISTRPRRGRRENEELYCGNCWQCFRKMTKMGYFP